MAELLEAVLARVTASLKQSVSAPTERARPEARGGDGVASSREARWLVAAVLGIAPAVLMQRVLSSAVVDEEAVARVDRSLTRRLAGEPLAYAVGSAAFRELVLAVDRRALIPRPETEVVVGEALKLTAERPGGIALDIGTGSGAIALSLAVEGRFERVIATDVSLDALDLARENAARVAVEYPASAPVEFVQGADLAPFATQPSGGGGGEAFSIRARVLVSNPPYIAYGEAQALPPSVRDWEPPVALFAAEQGMARYQALLADASGILEPGGWVVLETDARRAQDTARLAAQAGFEAVRVIEDLSGRERVLVARYGS